MFSRARLARLAGVYLRSALTERLVAHTLPANTANFHYHIRPENYVPNITKHPNNRHEIPPATLVIRSANLRSYI